MAESSSKKPQQTVNERLKILIESLNMSARAFSAAIGMPDSNTRNYLSKNTKLNSDYLESIASHFSHVNLGWLITGIGEPFLANKEGSTIQTGNSNQAGSGNFQNVKGNKNQNITGDNANVTNLTLSDCKRDLEAAKKEVVHLQDQLARADALLASREEMLNLLRIVHNRPN